MNYPPCLKENIFVETAFATAVLNNTDAERALWVWTLIGIRGRGISWDKEELVHFLESYGFSKVTVWRFMRALVMKHKATGGGEITFAFKLPNGRYQSHGYKRVYELAELKNIGRVTIPYTDFAVYKQYRKMLYIKVAYGHNRDHQNSTTISRAGITKLTGKSEETQRRIEREFGIAHKRNYVQEVRSNAESKQFKDRPRTTYGKRRHKAADNLIQIRNTYRPLDDGSTKLCDPKTNHYIVTTQARTVPLLLPHKEQFVARHTWAFGQLPTAATLEQQLNNGIDVDIMICDRPMASGELVGFGYRFVANNEYTREELESILAKLAQEPLMWALSPYRVIGER
jgi:hypothetical protein